MTSGRIPEWTRELVVKKCSADTKPVYHDAVLEKRPLQQLKHGEILVKISAVSFNRRDVSVIFGYALVNTRESNLGTSLVLMEQVM
ncbi:hypothetical protein AZE42_05356 [Rhizopogon vesiculosus]|uniref:Uncharacterized protein n=1 Tax=Rhizopogon vesiculosus TaxID=180088 RepID=A0A1J8QHL5_9AGAM|nr:hypothetical protein AZE42_05356 [Rhizopogon vesiculosus]